MLVIGTANRKKGLELAGLLRPLGIECRTLADFARDCPAEVVEDGKDFAANARLKAAGYARQLGQWVLADDSGLEVDALDGRPGVFSARFAGPNADDEANNRLLLASLGKTPLEQRTAQFVCNVALSDPTGKIRAEAAAACRGRIVFQPRGHAGFGYDPLFEIIEYHRTFAELGLRVKACLSHRSRAVKLILPRLGQLAETNSFY
jgi:XTP/dITP diphosphohydrolase